MCYLVLTYARRYLGVPRESSFEWARSSWLRNGMQYYQTGVEYHYYYPYYYYYYYYYYLSLIHI